jgi:hypothetical protein
VFTTRKLTEQKREIDILRKLDHPSIVKIHETWTRFGKLYICMEYAPNGSLLDKARASPMDERAISEYMRQVLEGLVYLHAQGVVHHDIKGSNILLSADDKVKLADFGTSLRGDYSSVSDGTRMMGTPFWMSPERIRDGMITEKSDIWAVGITAIELFTGGYPPYMDIGLNAIQASYKIAMGNPPPIPPSMSSKTINFLELCFNQEPELRCSAGVLLETCPFLATKLPIRDDSREFGDILIYEDKTESLHTFVDKDDEVYPEYVECESPCDCYYDPEDESTDDDLFMIEGGEEEECDEAVVVKRRRVRAALEENSIDTLFAMMDPTVADYIASMHGVGEIADALFDTAAASSTVVSTLRLINRMITMSESVCEAVCNIGCVPEILKFSKATDIKIRLQVADFIANMITRPRFQSVVVACGCLKSLNDLLNGPYEENKDIIHTAVKCIILILNRSTQCELRNFASILARKGVFPKLIATIGHAGKYTAWSPYRIVSSASESSLHDSVSSSRPVTHPGELTRILPRLCLDVIKMMCVLKSPVVQSRLARPRVVVGLIAIYERAPMYRRTVLYILLKISQRNQLGETGIVPAVVSWMLGEFRILVVRLLMNIIRHGEQYAEQAAMSGVFEILATKVDHIEVLRAVSALLPASASSYTCARALRSGIIEVIVTTRGVNALVYVLRAVYPILKYRPTETIEKLRPLELTFNTSALVSELEKLVTVPEFARFAADSFGKISESFYADTISAKIKILDITAALFEHASDKRKFAGDFHGSRLGEKGISPIYDEKLENLLLRINS